MENREIRIHRGRKVIVDIERVGDQPSLIEGIVLNRNGSSKGMASNRRLRL